MALASVEGLCQSSWAGGCEMLFQGGVWGDVGETSDALRPSFFFPHLGDRG